MFTWDKVVTFRGVGGEWLHPLGVCSVYISFGGHLFRAEFTVLPRTTHDVILGIDFLKQCGATVDCRSREIFIDGTALSALVENPGGLQTALDTFWVLEDPNMPARCALFVPVWSSGAPNREIDALVEPISPNCAKKKTSSYPAPPLNCYVREGFIQAREQAPKAGVRQAPLSTTRAEIRLLFLFSREPSFRILFLLFS